MNWLHRPEVTAEQPTQTPPWHARDERLDQQVAERLDRIREHLALIERRKQRDDNG